MKKHMITAMTIAILTTTTPVKAMEKLAEDSVNMGGKFIQHIMPENPKDFLYGVAVTAGTVGLLVTGYYIKQYFYPTPTTEKPIDQKSSGILLNSEQILKLQLEIGEKTELNEKLQKELRETTEQLRLLNLPQVHKNGYVTPFLREDSSTEQDSLSKKDVESEETVRREEEERLNKQRENEEKQRVDNRVKKEREEKLREEEAFRVSQSEPKESKSSASSALELAKAGFAGTIEPDLLDFLNSNDPRAMKVAEVMKNYKETDTLGIFPISSDSKTFRFKVNGEMANRAVRF